MAEAHDTQNPAGQCSPEAKSTPQPVFINQILLAHITLFHWHVVYGCPHAIMAELTTRTVWPAESKIFALQPFREHVCLPDSSVEPLPAFESCAYWVRAFILKSLKAHCHCYCNCIILMINCVNWWNKRSKGVLLWEPLLVVPTYSTSFPWIVESQVSARWWPPAIELHFLGSLAARYGCVTAFQPVGGGWKLCMQLAGHDFKGRGSALCFLFPLPAGCSGPWDDCVIWEYGASRRKEPGFSTL